MQQFCFQRQAENTGGAPPQDTLEPSREPPEDVSRDPSPQDALEVVSPVPTVHLSQLP